MRNGRARFVIPFLTASLLVSSSVASTALARNGRGGGKKAMGEVTAFDSATMDLEVELRNGDTFEGTVAPDVQVKLEHRGHHSHNHGDRNPSRGSVDDIVPGAGVLRMKLDKEGVVDKIRLRPAKTDPCAPVEEPVVEEPEEPVVEEPVVDDPVSERSAHGPRNDEGDCDEAEDSDSDDSDDDDDLEDDEDEDENENETETEGDVTPDEGTGDAV
ncbi:MAG: hypothetical protein ACRDLB_02430 [Actinomycetota bacterium]